MSGPASEQIEAFLRGRNGELSEDIKFLARTNAAHTDAVRETVERTNQLLMGMLVAIVMLMVGAAVTIIFGA